MPPPRRRRSFPAQRSHRLRGRVRRSRTPWAVQHLLPAVAPRGSGSLHQDGGMKGRLTVDPIACTGHGACAELLPEWIELDDWGSPMLNAELFPADLLPHARRAVASCPTLALRLAAVRE